MFTRSCGQQLGNLGKIRVSFYTIEGLLCHPATRLKMPTGSESRTTCPANPANMGRPPRTIVCSLMPSFGSPRPVPRGRPARILRQLEQCLAAARPLGQQRGLAAGVRHPPRPGFGVGDLGLHCHPGPSPRCGHKKKRMAAGAQPIRPWGGAEADSRPRSMVPSAGSGFPSRSS